ncbi:hypothetical protein THRCLA_06163 [Thraustotheca clavata]|uniref:START domain-containing protein n=1 Tax=Thraustotheca clavata TaxID=74557 RepID=A0A1V9ZQ81_9STRA|nr:hypothetical protein THRCLA_06163 [Thraustotheca clavata]
MERYVERAKAEKFLLEDGQDVEASILLRVEPAKAYALWATKCWGSKLPLQVGQVRETHQGREKLSVVAAPEEGNESDRIASVHYELIENQGWFFHGYKAMVSFVPDSKNSANTLVIWVVKYDPTQTGNVFCCGGSVLRLVSRNYLKNQLEKLQSS